jgi:pepF/M3 family oligoendopeptidase
MPRAILVGATARPSARRIDQERSMPSAEAPSPTDDDAVAADVLPRWDVASLFPSVDSREFALAHEALLADLGRLHALYDDLDVGGDPARPATAEALESVVTATNEVMRQVRLVGAYLYAHIAADATDDRAASLHARFQIETTDLAKLSTRFDRWASRLSIDVVAQSAVATEHAFPIERAGRAAEHTMSGEAEELAADLRLSGSAAWSRLHRDVTARLTAPIRRDPDGDADDVTELPMTVVRGRATHPDRAVREEAYRAELVAWDGVAIPLAAALNGAKGEATVLNRRRGWDDALAPALFVNNVDRPTLDALQHAVVDALPDFRRYLRAKHRWLTDRDGGLAWSDLLAPMIDRHDDGAAGSRGAVAWTDATDHVHRSFGTYSPALASLADRAFAEQWVDAGPRPGKVGGAFCMPLGDGSSRVLLNFDGSFDSVQTLAHELGHAYHNSQLAERTPMQSRTPMALAETASIFCETIAVEAGLQSASDANRLTILDTDLQGATQVVVDIHSRFLFERELCRRRERQTLAVGELSELMLDAQEQAYGDGLDADLRHPFMWAVKSHYFTPFYNWPYTFGLLFGVGLYRRYQDDPERFRLGYDDLLSSTGLADAASLAARFDIDVRSEAFWSSSLDVIRRRIDELIRLTA